MKNFLFTLLCTLLFCQQLLYGQSNEKADLIIYGYKIYTMNPEQPYVEAIAVKDGKIMDLGERLKIVQLQGKDTEIIGFEDDYIYPGFIESHGHLMSLGESQHILGLSTTNSYEELLEKVQIIADTLPAGEWIIGRGWHQEKWNNDRSNWNNGLPENDRLNKITQAHPVILVRAGGHSALVNEKAFSLASVEKGKIPHIDGGTFDVDKNKQLTGMVHENAVAYMKSFIPTKKGIDRMLSVYKDAISICHENGITTFVDAGIAQNELAALKTLYQDPQGLRLYEMLSGTDVELMKQYIAQGPIVDEDNWLTIRAIKLYVDGALGNRGAWLQEEYSDMPGYNGIPLMKAEEILRMALIGLDNGFQVCTHAIGDRANKEALDAYEKAFRKRPKLAKNARFRIEHAQVIDAQDIPRFGKLGVVASMQGIHLSSDRPWAEERLGIDRIVEGAYVWQALLRTGACIVAGTDVPVEPINPIENFYAMISRKTLRAEPKNGYEPDQKMTRIQALKAYTSDAAYGIFMDDVIGTIEVGKYADFTILSQDIMTVQEDYIPLIEVTGTIVHGKVEYRRK